MEAKMKEEAERQLQEQENNKREEIERLRKQLERKYNDDVSSLKEEESSAGELKRLLLDKANQMKNAM